MRYISTRSQAPSLSFSDALLRGLAPDGGLFVPETLPFISAYERENLGGSPYEKVATSVISPFLGSEFEETILSDMTFKTARTFHHPSVAPLIQIDDNLFILELFHGPTFAFKDIAMQFLGRMMDYILSRHNKRMTIVAATSGDTGAAAIEAFSDLSHFDVFILYPNGRVSDIQRRQMTCVQRDHIHTLAIDGTFDDCQAIVKALFNDHAFQSEFNISGVNSINCARIIAQIVYYFTSALTLGGTLRPVSFTVPTGNFGNVLAGFYAKNMSLPIERLVIATNENDILARALTTGLYSIQDVRATPSPSMDIQISSNFERLLFEAYERDTGAICRLMEDLRHRGQFKIDSQALERIHADFDAYAALETRTEAQIARVWHESGYLLDPHTAVGVHAARLALAKNPRVPMIVLGTAHPAKFEQVVTQATGTAPPLPPKLAELLNKPEYITQMPNNVLAIQRLIRERSKKQ